MQVRVEEKTEEIGRCGCGRSPTGKCVGFHALSEDEWTAGKTQLCHALLAGQKLDLPKSDE
jgi:hypothetical protein